MEVACWLQVKAERRYAGVSHIDVDNTSAGEPVETIVPLLPETKISGIRRSVLSLTLLSQEARHPFLLTR